MIWSAEAGGQGRGPVPEGRRRIASGENLGSSLLFRSLAGSDDLAKKGRTRFGSALAGLACRRLSQRLRLTARDGFGSVVKRVARPIHIPVSAHAFPAPAAVAAAFELVVWRGALGIRKTSDRVEGKRNDCSDSLQAAE